MVVVSVILAGGLRAATGAGAPACASCHRSQALSQPATLMAHALEAATDSKILKSNPNLVFREGSFAFRITREGDRSIYTVTQGAATFTAPLAFAFGLGSAGQTYVYERNGTWYESRVSYYEGIHGLDVTLGHAKLEEESPEVAAGRELSIQESVDCFGCHASNAVRSGRLHLETLVPGVQCERCHASAEKHAAAVKSGDAANAAIRHLSALSTEEMSDFCGQCHRTWSQVAMKGPHNINNVRFQPYRLTNSRCYDPTDRRISCVACHDPHREVERNAASYDLKCLACHAGGHKIPAAAQARRAKACPAATRNCVSCHMPKYEIPGSHNLFSDHQIRIARPGEPYPG